MHVPPSLPGNSCEPLSSFQLRICSNPSIAVLLVVLTRSSGQSSGVSNRRRITKCPAKGYAPDMSRNEPHRRHRNSLRRRFFAPRFEATPSLRVAPLRDSLADEEATLFLSHPGRTAFRTTDWIYSPRMPRPHH